MPTFSKCCFALVGLLLLIAACIQESGRECEVDGECPPGRYCQVTTGQCVFDCSTDRDCPGDQQCSARGRCGCIETNGGQEDCDGQDNDCDGDTDEELYGGECFVDFDLGRCPGRELCVNQDWFCDVTRWPDYQQPETSCDSLDNDCDGETDEELVGEACSVENGYGRCDGFNQCINGGWECDAPEPAPEQCDNLDNDCNGQVDEGLSPTGECEVGAQASDGIDNNCDGLTDEPGGCMVHVQMGDVDVYVDQYENTVFENSDCTGRRYGEHSNDFPITWPPQPITATEVLYPCSLPGLIPSRFVSLYQSMRACEAQGKRLCSQAEWAAACGGESQLTYTYGDSFQTGVCNSFDNGLDDAVPTGSLEGCLSPIGTYDMSGNLSEWIQDMCASDASQGLVQGGSFLCRYCGLPGNCVPCDLDNPEHQTLISQWYQCHHPGTIEMCVAPPWGQGREIGFRCCYNPP